MAGRQVDAAVLLAVDGEQVGQPQPRRALVLEAAVDLDGRHQGRVVAVDPGRELTARIMGAHMSYVVLPQGERTRLLLKVVARTSRVLAPALALGDLPMARKQLLTFFEAWGLMDKASIRGRRRLSTLVFA